MCDDRQGFLRHMAEFFLHLVQYGKQRAFERAKASETGRAAAAILETIVTRVAAAGRLRMSVDRAVQVNQAMCTGVALSLIEADEPDLGLSAVVREAALRATVTGLPEPGETAGVASRAVALRAALPSVEDVPLSPGEHALLLEWLDRLADHTG